MAARGPNARKRRLDPRHDEHVRAKIQTSQIVNRLISCVEGSVKMAPSQVTAALGLLKKILPDLSAIENTGQSQVAFVIRAPEPVELASDWERQNAPKLVASSTYDH